LGWLRNNDSASAIVFVHGLWLFDNAPWRNKNGASWPQIALDDPELAGHGIYQFDYLSGFSSENYTPEKVVASLASALESLMATRQRLIFVCHSLGGILVRRWLVQNDARLVGAGKEIDLLLVASPSLGSPYAGAFRARVAKRAGLEHVSVLYKTRRDGWLGGTAAGRLSLMSSRAPTAGN
jgi:triacylglycerol esterase/lipase EstA (alpha/beta hydrolase family)